MYIWEFEIITKWTFNNDEDEGDGESYIVAAGTFEDAWTKVKKLALSKSRIWIDGEDNNKRHKPLSTQLTKAERGDWIDG